MDAVELEIKTCAAWSDEELTAKLALAAQDERTALVPLLVRLGEFVKRELSERKGYSHVYDYLTRKVGYSRSAAGRRVAASKAARSYPSVLTMLERGDVHLTAVAMLQRYLTSENHESLLRRAKGKSEEEIDRMIAAIAPRVVPRERIRAVRAQAPSVSSAPAVSVQPAPTPAESHAAELFDGLPPAASAPASEAVATEPEVYDVRFPADAETVALIKRAKELLRHKFPAGETGAIVKLALRKLLGEIDRDLRSPPKRRQEAEAPQKSAKGRHIPETVKQQAWERDGGQCAFVAEDGTRCTARSWLEFDHEIPYASGGNSKPENIRPYCRPHNLWAARQAFGERVPPPG